VSAATVLTGAADKIGFAGLCPDEFLRDCNTHKYIPVIAYTNAFH
jgi:hypothetical protein